MKRRRKQPDIDAIFEDGTLIDKALEEARQRAFRKHARMGLPVVLWVDGKIQWVDAKKLLDKPLRKRRRAKK